MKKTVTTLLAVLFATVLAAQDMDLPAPHRTGGMPLMEALARRRSSREFDGRELPKQTLSDLLWAAWGYNRADKRTAPSSRDKQEIELYVAMKGGLYRFARPTNSSPPHTPIRDSLHRTSISSVPPNRSRQS